MIPGFLFDIAALPRFVLGALPWWTALIAAGGVWFIAGGIRAAARLSLALVAVTLGTFLAASAWLADHPTITSGEPETTETVGGVE